MKPHIMCNNLFIGNISVHEIKWKNFFMARQATLENAGYLNSKKKHLEYFILIAFPLQQWSQEC